MFTKKIINKIINIKMFPFILFFFFIIVFDFFFENKI